MKNVIQNPKVIAATATILVIMCSVWISAVHVSKGDLENDIKEERLKSEAYLSEKLSLDKEISKMKTEFKNLIGQNAELDKAIFTANKKLVLKEAEVDQLRKDARSIKEAHTIKNFQKKLDELKQIKQELEQQLALVNATLTNLKKDNVDLHNTIALLELKNKSLEDELNSVKLATIDEIRIEVVKKKSQRLTATARKTKKMIVTFEVPAALQCDLSYKITGPTGNLLTDKNGSITSVIMPDKLILTASIYTAETPKKKQIQMIYETKEKLQSGVYTIEVSNNGLHIGSLQVRLR